METFINLFSLLALTSKASSPYPELEIESFGKELNIHVEKSMLKSQLPAIADLYTTYLSFIE